MTQTNDLDLMTYLVVIPKEETLFNMGFDGKPIREWKRGTGMTKFGPGMTKFREYFCTFQSKMCVI